MKKFAAILFLAATPLFAQSNTGELRLKITDPDGLAVKTTIQITSHANQYRSTLTTNEQGRLDVQRLPYGIYQLEIKQSGFAEIDESVDIHSEIPTDYTIRLLVSSVKESVTVTAPNTLLDPDQPASINHVGTDDIQTRVSSIPGRSLQDLVNSQPGWLYEGNAVLHPRGSEYQTQIVVDGIPLTDNRSPSFGPAIDADDIQSLSIYTGGIPAEYGRKMGGIVEVNTLQDSQQGFHGQLELSGGSFATAASAAQAQYVWGKNTLGASASGSMSGHYLNPVVPENFTNNGTLGDFSTNYERDLTPKDRLRFIVRHELARYEIPNELVQQDPQLISTLGGQPSPPPGTPAQLQTAANFETMGSVTYQHIFSPNVLIDARGMVRDNSNDFYSNPYSWPIIVNQHNDFKEGYFHTSVSIHQGHHEWKAGLESDNIFLHENYSDVITANPNYPVSYPFDPGTVTTFAFTGHRPDLEQSAYIQDLIHARQLDRQRRPPLGSLPAPSQSKCRKPASSRSAFLSKNKRDAPLLLRPHLSNSIVREHPALQLPRSPILRAERPPPARATLPRQLLRSRSQQKLLRTIPPRRQPLPPRRQQLRRRRPDFQHQHQLSHRLRKSHPLRSRSQTRTPALEALLRLPERIVHSRQRLVPSHRRPSPGRKQNLYQATDRQHLSPAKRTFPRLARPAPQPSRTPSLPDFTRASGSPPEFNMTPVFHSRSTPVPPKPWPNTDRK